MNPAIARDEALVYISDFANNDVSVLDQKTGSQVGQIGGLLSPQGVFVDTARNLWVADTGNYSVEVYPQGATSPSETLNDPAGFPVAVTICPDRSVYVSNIFDFTTGSGSIQVYSPGSTNPTRTLQFGHELENFWVTCDAVGNLFATILNAKGVPAVVEYPNANQAHAKQIWSAQGSPGDIDATNSGYLIFAGKGGLCTYRETGGKPISCLKVSGSNFALNRAGKELWTLDPVNLSVVEYAYPGGKMLNSFGLEAAEPIGIALAPGQAF